MSVKDFNVLVCDRKDIKQFIEKWHYSKSINGIMSSYCFKLMNNNEIIGGMIFGKLGMANAWKKYAENAEDVIELRRLCCIDDTPKNTESFFIGACLRWLKKNTNIKIIVSYADPEYGHSGIIYQASNFTMIGKTSPGKVIFWNDKKYHDKAIRTKYKGELKPFARRLKNAIESGQARYVKTNGKNIYIFKLKR